MPAVTQRTWLIAGVILLVIAAFGLGFLAGRNNPPAAADTPPAITAADMRGLSFGNRPLAQESAMQPPAAHEQTQQAGNLSTLVTSLEKKVAANPDNLEQQLLLARTYQELGERDKGLKLLRKLHQRDSGNPELNLTLATVLMAGSDKQELQESERLLEGAVSLNPQTTAMARLYQGDIQLKLGDRARALKIWKGYLARLPAGSEQRALFQERIKQASQR